MGGQFVTAAFFVPLELRPASDAKLLEALGCAHGSLGPLAIADPKIGIDVLDNHACVRVRFLRRSFLELLADPDAGEVPLEQDPALPLAMALRDGAARAHAEVAMLVTDGHAQETLLDRYWMVLLRDASALAAESFPVLYLGDVMVRDWAAPPELLASRDELPSGPGRTLFAQRGADRWY